MLTIKEGYEVVFNIEHNPLITSISIVSRDVYRDNR